MDVQLEALDGTIGAEHREVRLEEVIIIPRVTRTQLYANDLSLHDLGLRRRGFLHLEWQLDVEAVTKHARCCSEVKVPIPRDLIATNLLTVGVDLVDRPLVEALVWRGVQSEPALR